MPGVAQMYYIVPDHLDTPRMIADQAGTTVWRWDQAEPFGSTPPNDNPSGAGAFDFPLRFPGQYADKETNLAYNYFRDYDPSIGRYLQYDPAGFSGGLNPYSYTDSNPVAFVDPHGDSVIGGIAIAITAYMTYRIGMSLINAAAAAKMCGLEKDALAVAALALEACQRRKSNGQSCDCSSEIDQYDRAWKLYVNACGLQFGGAAGGAANRSGARVPGMSSR